MVEEVVCPECRNDLKRHRYLFFMAAVLGLVVATCMLIWQWGSLEERDKLAQEYNKCAYNLSVCMNKPLSLNITHAPIIAPANR